MKSGGCFFEEPEFAALADVLGTTVVVDSMVVMSGFVDRRSFFPTAKPKDSEEGTSAKGVVHLYLSVCSLNASHCEAVVKSPGAST